MNIKSLKNPLKIYQGNINPVSDSNHDVVKGDCMNAVRPRLIVASASSGRGKTTITMGLIRALKSIGKEVYPFKTGPDYIDPGFHSLCAERPCYNLDTVLMGKDGVINCLIKNSRAIGITVIEGVMGLYDGNDETECSGSTADTAKITKTPVIVLIDAGATAQTAGAIALGMKLYDNECPVAGFILNRIGSQRHFNISKNAIENVTGLPVFGYLPKLNEIKVPERHLGLVAAWENSEKDNPDNPVYIADKVSSVIKDFIDLEQIKELAYSAVPLKKVSYSISKKVKENSFNNDEPRSKTSGNSAKPNKIKIGVAMDNAFHFYYKQNLEILESMGAELVFFSPVADSSLPRNISGIYIGGGYPENYAFELENNFQMKNSIQKISENEMPVFAECGGLMYLAKTILIGTESYSMTGVFDIHIKMGSRLSAVGYYTGHTSISSFIGPAGLSVSGHIFRWSQLIDKKSCPPNLFKLKKGEQIIKDGFLTKNTIGSYLHFHFAGSPFIANNFIESCKVYKNRCLNINREK